MRSAGDMHIRHYGGSLICLTVANGRIIFVTVGFERFEIAQAASCVIASIFPLLFGAFELSAAVRIDVELDGVGPFFDLEYWTSPWSDARKSFVKNRLEEDVMFVG